MATESPSQRTLIETSDIEVSNAKQNGDAAEQWAIDHYDLAERDTDICPEAAHDAVDPRTGTPIEVKSCQIRHAGGQRGRFQLWDYAHDILAERGGGYIFVVHESRCDQFHPYFHRPLSAQAVDALISGWNDIGHDLRPDEARRTSLGQSRIFTDIQIERIAPEEAPEDPDRDTEASEAEPDAATEDPEEPRIPQMERMKETKQTIRQIEEQHDENHAPHNVVVSALAAKNIPERKAESHIEGLKKKGEIYSPQPDVYRTV